MKISSKLLIKIEGFLNKKLVNPLFVCCNNAKYGRYKWSVYVDNDPFIINSSNTMSEILKAQQIEYCKDYNEIIVISD